jgi:hypothetical protein
MSSPLQNGRLKGRTTLNPADEPIQTVRPFRSVDPREVGGRFAAVNGHWRRRDIEGRVFRKPNSYSQPWAVGQVNHHIGSLMLGFKRSVANYQPRRVRCDRRIPYRNRLVASTAVPFIGPVEV